MQLIPIGTVRRPSARHHDSSLADLKILPAYVEHCAKIEELSHLLVLWWAHERVDERFAHSRVHPKRREDLPLVGLFCTRSPVRPNPICADVVKVVSVTPALITVRGLQANDGTPLLDIKGWYRTVPDEEVVPPSWHRRLREE